MSELQLTGMLSQIGDVEVISDKFSKRQFVIQVHEGQYTKTVALQFVNDKTSKLDGLQLGQEVTVKFNIESREYNGKWFTNLTAWYLSKGEAANTGYIPNAQPAQQPVQQPYTPAPQSDGMPF